MPIRTALISVSDKTGIVELARGLQEFDVKILSTGGTAKTLRAAGIPVCGVSDYTGSPEILGGRVKTLHPKIHGGILYLRGDFKQVKEAGDHNIDPIDMVVVNLYPFEETVKKKSVSFSEAVEQIDIGGPSMLRSAAKNFEHVTVLEDPTFYQPALALMRQYGGDTTLRFRADCAEATFKLTSSYDAHIARYIRDNKSAIAHT